MSMIFVDTSGHPGAEAYSYRLPSVLAPVAERYAPVLRHARVSLLRP